MGKKVVSKKITSLKPGDGLKQTQSGNIHVCWSMGLVSKSHGFLEVSPQERLTDDAWWERLQEAARQVFRCTVDGLPGVFDYETIFSDPSVKFTDEQWRALSFKRFVELGGTLVVVPDKPTLKAHFAAVKAACEGKLRCVWSFIISYCI